MPCHTVTLSLSNALAGRRGIIAPGAHRTLLGTTDSKTIVVLTSNHPACNVRPITRYLRLRGQKNCVLSCGNNGVIGARANRGLFARFLPSRMVPVLCECTERGGRTLLKCTNGRVVARVPSSRCIGRRSHVGGVGVHGMRRLLRTLRPRPAGLLVANSPSSVLGTRRRLLSVINSGVSIFHSTPFFLRLMPGKVSGTRSLEELLTGVGLAPTSVVTFNSNCGSLDVLGLTNVKMTVTGTTPRMETSTSCVALSGRRSNMTTTLRRFNV